MKKLVAFAGLGLAFVAASLPARSFQEQRLGGEAAAPEKPTQDGKPAQNLSTADGEAAKGGSGTEVRIPGLGKLGVIPKVDFGLELLYGAADTKRPTEPPAGPENADGVTLRGKLRF